jgi:transcription initiation factor TFIIIB Brf1 subunit/transcription initiation factor TFIIB
MMLEMDSRDRAMLDASRRIRCMQQTQGNGISAAVASVAERMFRTVLESESLKGSRREGLLEGVMFAAARSCGCARTVSEIATMFNNDHTKVLGGIRRVLEVIDQRGFRVSPRDFTRRFVMRIPAASEPGTTMWHLVDQYVLCLEQTDRYEDEAPHVVAAAAISLAWEHTGRTGGDALAALASGVSRSTVRKCVKKLGPERLQTVTLVTERLAGAQIAWTSGRERKRVASERNNLR